MEQDEEIVILEIEGMNLECSKQLLMRSSDYFLAMFRGSFKESSQKNIKIEGVDIKSFNTILLLLYEESHVVDIEDIHRVLQAACMLQFRDVKKKCENWLFHFLKPSVCVKIWKTTELLAITPLWQKAKYMALEEFEQICDSESVLELCLDDICLYLGHIHLKAKNEFSVFQTAVNWWYSNQLMFVDQNSTKILLKLLCCVNFKKIPSNQIKEFRTYPDISKNTEIKSILNCVIELLEKGLYIESEFDETHFKYAIHLCNSKSRQVPEIPCILLQSELTESGCPNKKLKFNQSHDRNVVIYDKFRRKRYLREISDHTAKSIGLSSAIYDYHSESFKYIFEIDGDKLKDLAGFKCLSYKELVLIFGGEYIIGAGNWNTNFWTYDTIKEKWELRTKLPQGRRHFETVIADSCLYILGGVGRFRVIQENFLCYDFKTDQWSASTLLPHKSADHRPFKCCTFMNELFLVYLSDKRGYFFNKKYGSWRKVDLKVENEIVTTIGDYTVLSDSDYLYIKGKYLLKFKLVDDNLLLKYQRSMKDIDYEESESVLCNSTIYTLYRCLDEHYEQNYTFEAFDLDADKLHYIFKMKYPERDVIDVGDKPFCLSQYSKLFTLHYYNLVKENIYINEFII